MKALVRTNTVVDGKKVTITGELIDVTFPDMVAQRHNTMLHPVNGHPSKPRHIQSNSHGFLVLRKGSDGILFPKDEMVAIGLEIDSKLTDVPVFVEHPTKENLSGKVISEIASTGKIQQSDDGKTWTDVGGADSNLKGESGKHYRCVASNKNGETASNPVHIPDAKS
jgi:hypothetical protein